MVEPTATVPALNGLDIGEHTAHAATLVEHNHICTVPRLTRQAVPGDGNCLFHRLRRLKVTADSCETKGSRLAKLSLFLYQAKQRVDAVEASCLYAGIARPNDVENWGTSQHLELAAIEYGCSFCVHHERGSMLVGSSKPLFHIEHRPNHWTKAAAMCGYESCV